MTQFRSLLHLLLLAALPLLTARAAAAAPQTSPLAPQERLCDPAFQDCRADILTYIQQETVEIDMGFWMMTDARYSNALVKALAARRQDPAADGSALRRCAPGLQRAERPARRRPASRCGNRRRERHPALEVMIFAGQGQIEFAGANYAPFELTPEMPYVNYTDEIVFFTNNPSLVHSFMTKFDDLWMSTTEFADYANITAPLTRSYPIYRDRSGAELSAGRELSRPGARRLRRRAAADRRADVPHHRRAAHRRDDRARSAAACRSG